MKAFFISHKIFKDELIPMTLRILFTTMLLILTATFIGCGDNNSEKTTAIEIGTDTTEPEELTIMVHSAFDISDSVIKEFEEKNNSKVIILKAGSSGEGLNRAILEKGNPSADLLYGIDNTYLGRALDEDLFIKYKSDNLMKVDEQFILDKSHHVMPINYGYVNINYDKQYLLDNDLKIPKSLEELTNPEWKNMLVVENPSTSSPGLAFLLTTIAYFGESGSYTYLNFWKDLKNNGVLVKDSWSDAYYTDFSKNGGSRPLVISYATSPAAEVFFSETPIEEPPTANILIDRATFLQIEGIGILKGSENIILAKKFVDFAMDTTFQEDLPSKMFVYPVNKSAKTPDFFKFAEVPTIPALLSSDEIGRKREQWIDSWTTTVLR